MESLSLHNAKVKYISCKEQFDQQYAYFVIDHEKTKEEFKKVLEKYPGVKLPFFVSETTGDYILKVSAKRIAGFSDLVLHDTYKANVSMAGYSFNDNKGFYAQQPTTKWEISKRLLTLCGSNCLSYFIG